MNPKMILASRSPRRRELLARIVPVDQIEVVPPQSPVEEGFDALHDWAGIERRLREIARAKCQDVLDQVAGSVPAGGQILVAADTIIVVSDDAGKLTVLGQPPADETWTHVVEKWFFEYYAGKTHVAATALCVAASDGRVAERVVKTEVTFHSDVARWFPWYMATEEPRGKAGGYAIQGAGSVFVSKVRGSLSNVVGLPLEELLQVFAELNLNVGPVLSS